MADSLRDLRQVPVTYAEVGATRGELPAGYHHVRMSRVVGHGRDDFEVAGEAVMRWEAQRRSGIRVEATDERAQPGTVVRLHIGPGSLVTAPARVVYVVDEPGRRGLAYGTLPGHPELGEEAFVVELRSDASVLFTVTAFSRAGTLLTRLGGPVNRAFQRFMSRRYLAAVEQAVRES